MPLTYKKSGVDYTVMDLLKLLAQKAGLKTASNLILSGFLEVEKSRGESAYVIEAKDHYLAFVQEGLGTKNIVADEMEKITGKTYYSAIAQDTVAMIINDLITVGATPSVILAYWAVGDSRWFANKKRADNLVSGWAQACHSAGAAWGGGETPTLSGIIEKGTIDLGGSAFGIIKPKANLTLGDNLQEGDAIVVFESSGIHANGLTLARKLSEKLPQGYKTKISNGQMYGEALLTPTTIYAKLIPDIQKSVDIHYMANITGHGWRKLMRSSKQFTYRITSLPPVPEVLQLICEKGPVSSEEAYANFNMGAGFAIYVAKQDVAKTLSIARKHKIKAYDVGSIEAGEKRVIIEPKKIAYAKNTLKVRT